MSDQLYDAWDDACNEVRRLTLELAECREALIQCQLERDALEIKLKQTVKPEDILLQENFQLIDREDTIRQQAGEECIEVVEGCYPALVRETAEWYMKQNFIAAIRERYKR